MKIKNNILSLIAMLLLVNLICAESVYAYVDPGTGSYIFQMFAATFIGASFAVKTYWRNISGYFTRLFNKNQKD